MANRPPTIRMRRLGAHLRRLREEQGLSLEEAATFLRFSRSALARMENAQVITRPRDVEYILLKYGVEDEELRAKMLGLASAGRSQEWVKRHGALVSAKPPLEYVPLEQDSSRIRAYHPTNVFGLLQTDEYARAIMNPFGNAPEDRLSRSVEYRMARKEALTRPDPLSLYAILGEAVLRQQIGGPAVLERQLRYLLAAFEQDNVHLRVLPFTAPRNPGVDGAFCILDVEEGNFSVVVLESRLNSVFMERDEGIDVYATIFDELWAVALTADESRELVEGAMLDVRSSSGRGANS
ncbi:helix-turn-helix transcriptional regulator [Actinomadura kijaniata]|uniref:Transcriptional regulator with XRE-family HTH domain n=1 Tax=Actinomadura namibiensis TaxID=182080 RepID=A0A7W3QKG1_ACTNM|nr:helix-turn-helix transcriptional regulator [Actinomadura namibiensis]MBA8950382.1 transcriptional regulator with XRE-family HTH domain [Actinomadura namibiensis]